MAQECPQCGLLNPSTARRCDCGYDFVTRPKSKAPVVDWRALLFSFDGRIGRSTYWLFLAPYMAVGVALASLMRPWIYGLPRRRHLSALFLVATLYPVDSGRCEAVPR